MLFLIPEDVKYAIHMLFFPLLEGIKYVTRTLFIHFEMDQVYNPYTFSPSQDIKLNLYKKAFLGSLTVNTSIC